MFDAVESLVLDLLEWVANGERSYDEVMDAWRTSCPRFPVWEDANVRGLVVKQHVDGRIVVRVTSSGLALLERRGLSIKNRAIPDRLNE
ncbi:hypothetical protein [Candidatus Binatus sp.]|uniref:hypothetical protein n=1 Tax=Candidatus Binatus sp. TaxID=2811406 RepID=UPI003CC60B94